MQTNLVSSDKPIYLSPDWVTLSSKFIKIWSVIVELLNVTLVGAIINYLNPNNVQNSW